MADLCRFAQSGFLRRQKARGQAGINGEPAGAGLPANSWSVIMNLLSLKKISFSLIRGRLSGDP